MKTGASISLVSGDHPWARFSDNMLELPSYHRLRYPSLSAISLLILICAWCFTGLWIHKKHWLCRPIPQCILSPCSYSFLQFCCCFQGPEVYKLFQHAAARKEMSFPTPRRFICAHICPIEEVKEYICLQQPGVRPAPHPSNGGMVLWSWIQAWRTQDWLLTGWKWPEMWLLESTLVECSVVWPYIKYTNFVDQK